MKILSASFDRYDSLGRLIFLCRAASLVAREFLALRLA
jgi:hypothetical protein